MIAGSDTRITRRSVQYSTAALSLVLAAGVMTYHFLNTENSRKAEVLSARLATVVSSVKDLTAAERAAWGTMRIESGSDRCGLDPACAELACELGLPWHCFAAAEILEKRQTEKDASRSVELYAEACKGGEHRACTRLGVALETGTGAHRDPARAGMAYERACEGGDDAEACARLAELLLVGEGVPINARRASRYELKAAQLSCDSGDAAACTHYATLVEREAPAVAGASHRASALLQRACEGGDAEGCIRAANSSRDDAVRVRFYERACDVGSADGCYKLGKQLNSDQRRAADKFERACRLSEGLGCFEAFALTPVEMRESKDDVREKACRWVQTQKKQGLFRGEPSGYGRGDWMEAHLCQPAQPR